MRLSFLKGRNEMIKALVFDKDGTLIKFEEFWLTVTDKAIDNVLDRFGARRGIKDIIIKKLGVRNGVADIEGILCSGTYGMICDVIYNTLVQDGVTCEIAELNRYVVDSFHKNMPYGNIVGISEDIEKIFKGFKDRGLLIGLVTSDDKAGAMYCLDTLGIREYFDVIYADDGINPHKPDKYYLEEFMKMNGLNRNEVIMVGDTFTDAEFAKNAGVRFVGVASDERNKLKLLDKSCAVISDLTELDWIIKEQNADE